MNGVSNHDGWSSDAALRRARMEKKRRPWTVGKGRCRFKKAGGLWKQTARLQLNSRSAPDQRPNASRQSKVRLSASTVMMETAGKYCISTVEIQYGFHAQLSSSRHTKGLPR